VRSENLPTKPLHSVVYQSPRNSTLYNLMY